MKAALALSTAVVALSGVGLARAQSNEPSRGPDACPSAERDECVDRAIEETREEPTAAHGRATLEAFCARDHAHACWALARVLHDGTGGPADEERATRLWRSGCDDGRGESCVSLGVQAEHREDRDEGLRASIPLFDEACRAGDARGCEYAADNVLRLEQTREAMERGAALFARACELTRAARACGLAVVYTRAVGAVARAPDERNVELRERCDGGDMESCDALGARLVVGHTLERSLSEGVDRLRTACRGGVARACFRLGRLFAVGHGVEANEQHAQALYAHACEHGHARACAASAQSEPAGERREGLLQRACDGGAGEVCYELAREDAEAGRHAEAYPRIARACAAGDAIACRAQGIMLYRGQGVEADEARGAQLFSDACAMGDGEACPR